MSIDRAKVKRRAAEANPADRVVQSGADLLRIYRAARTAGELLALEPRFNVHFKRRGRFQAVRFPDHVYRPGPDPMDTDKELFMLLAMAKVEAEKMPPDSEIGEAFWAKIQSYS